MYNPAYNLPALYCTQLKANYYNAFRSFFLYNLAVIVQI